MLRLPECMPGLSPAESSEMIHKLLIDSITCIFEYAKDADEDPYMGVDGSIVIESFFPDYLGGSGIPREKLEELSKMLVSSGEYTPDLEIEYAINKIIEDMEANEEATMETVRSFYDKAESKVPEDFFEELWECIFWDNDYLFLDEGYTLEMLKGSLIDKQMGITGGISVLPEQCERGRKTC